MTTNSQTRFKVWSRKRAARVLSNEMCSIIYTVQRRDGTLAAIVRSYLVGIRTNQHHCRRQLRIFSAAQGLLCR